MQKYSHTLPALETADQWRIVCDFDGTITPFDVTDAILERFADKEWEVIERQWTDGHITARTCMERQIGLISAPVAEFNDFLDQIPVTKGFAEFLKYCRSRSLGLLVVSDGMDYVIRRILGRHGFTHVPVVANRLLMDGRGGYRLEFPFSRAECPSGVCKCAVAGSNGDILLIGDGLSDCCLAGRAAMTLARRDKALQEYCELNGRPYLVYDDFFDISAKLETLLSTLPGKQEPSAEWLPCPA